MHPDRPRLPDLIAEELREGIASGRWSEWLPQERMLAAELKISRFSLQQALARLKASRELKAVPRKGHQIVSRLSKSLQVEKMGGTINLLLPGPAQEVRPTAVSWVDELRALLAARGLQLRPVEAKACYSASPERALHELFKRSPADCWLVRLSNLPMQRWLAQSGVPVVIAGTCHRGIDLHSVDVDHRALCRHATGALLAAGHRHIMLLVDADGKAGDLESELGFQEAIRAATTESIDVVLVRHNGQVRGVVSQLERALRRERPPTAIVVTQATLCLTLWSYLGARGLKIPQDISVVTQVGESYLSFLIPEPTAYRINQKKYAQSVLRAVNTAMTHQRERRKTLIVPEFVRGGSLASPPAS
ncbi:MAG TPA: substrate-binding domain-containing protein [Opitutaceae bacterium]|nr:substrate-binding domain-containing protein [Opitutaceae bacterium]